LLFLGEACALAHVTRPCVLARWAQEAGHDVHIACGPAYAEVVRAEGFEPLPLPAVDLPTLWQRLAKGHFFYRVEELVEYVDAELSLYRDLQPDLVIGDFRNSAPVSTAVAGLPLVSLLNAYWSDAHPCRFPPPRAGVFRWLPPALGQALFACIRPLTYRWFGTPVFNRLRQHYGLPPVSDFRAHYTAGTWCAYLDLPEVVPVPTLPANHFYLGPVIWQPRHGIPRTAEGLGSRRKLAYVSMGSSGDNSLLPNVLRALLALNFDCAVSGVGSETAASLHREFPELAGRARLAPLISPQDVLNRAVVTVCHGGSGTVYQSLAAGVPVLCLPSNPDLGLVATAVTAQGAGRTVSPGQATPRRLGRALTDLLEDSGPVAAARRLAGSLERHDTQARWLEFLEEAVPVTTRGAAVAEPVAALS
jgi:UDP:flavonoid glycosyltransferase YjiC (YdhE family)